MKTLIENAERIGYIAAAWCLAIMGGVALWLLDGSATIVKFYLSAKLLGL